MAPAPQVGYLRQLCGSAKTFARAQALLHVAQARTGPGSGHELGAGATGLPAICALIASLQLRNDDVSEEVAQRSSCLAPRVFKSTLATVNAVISESKTDMTSQGSADVMSYEALFQLHSIGGLPETQQRLLGWLAQAESDFLYADRVQRRYEGQTTLVKCAVFLWACTRVKIERDSLQDIVEQNNLPRKAFASLLKTLDKTCDAIGSRMSREFEAIRRAHRLSSQTKPKLKAQQQSQSATKQQPQAKFTPKRKTPNQPIPETPTKKRRLGGTTGLPAEMDGLPTARSLVPPPVASSSRITLDVLRAEEAPNMPTKRSHPQASIKPAVDQDLDASNVDELEEDSEDWPPPRRFRPVFLDQKQWFCRDGQLNSVWKDAEAHRDQMVALYGHPLESYGME